MDERQGARERLRAYIHPNEAVTEAQLDAFERAVDAQLEFERARGEGLPPGVASLTVGSYSVKMAESAFAAGAGANLAPAAWAILFNAGLLRRGLPVAQRL